MNRIDKIKRKKNLSYKKLEELSGVSATYICSLAKGSKRNPSLEVMQRISCALGEKADKIFEISGQA